MFELVFFVEGRSEKVMLEAFLPTILPPHISPRCVPFEGKNDLLRRLPTKLRAWQNPQSKFIILRDQDSGDCLKIKEKILNICRNENKNDAVVRIACRELESWSLGDLVAVEEGLQISGLVRHQNKKKFRNPDTLDNAAQELGKLTNQKYQKVSGSRAIGPHLNVKRNRSHSFRVFVEGVMRIVNSA
ncbi:MAG: DUF4276 family protein [Cyanobacteria bacterium P01_F01_bin.150]